MNLMGAGTLAIIETLRATYGNVGWTSGPGFLSAAANAACELPPDLSCVECGSGLSTSVLRRILGDRLVSLEHDPEHADRTGAHLSPLRRFGDYAWYDANGSLPDRIGLVVCDGPPRSLGGRYGAFPRLHGRLDPSFTFLLDDVNREEEMAVLDRWQHEYGPLSVRTVAEPDGRKFAILRRAA